MHIKMVVNISNIDKFLSSHGFKQIRQFKFRSKENVGSYYDILYKRDD